MKWKRILICVIAIMLMSSTVLFADSLNEKIRVLINGEEVSDGGYIINGRTYVPVREFNGIANFNSAAGKVTFYKPNVHIALFKGDTIFGNVNKGKLKFNVLSQVDNLKTDIAGVKVTITDPGGNVKDIQSQDTSNLDKDNFWFRTYDFTYDFKTTGKYKVGFYMKEDKDSGYILIAEKVITALD
ncbi:copper amine oxidase [Paenibacillus sp. JX-17]|uniref:Copper amine oxidase n=1 Tax=Paenibacillus lacisoli TaxID=3064525 RepID=A0ABT9C7Q6_9BACL|nr:copper amine oxidase [Paenibacillus sp. JX-17]MDO7905299.1 copper amine oxidase [Paenibacillus sp. JX-17]